MSDKPEAKNPGHSTGSKSTLPVDKEVDRIRKAHEDEGDQFAKTAILRGFRITHAHTYKGTGEDIAVVIFVREKT